MAILKLSPSNHLISFPPSWLSSSSAQSWPPSFSTISKNPGVYWFLDRKNRLLYLGKAKNLNHRLSSYRRSRQTPKNALMLRKTLSFNFHETNSELEATLLEAALINRFQPTYNIDLKDDKSPLYIVITQDEFPRVLTVRKSDLNSLKIKSVYGPYLSAYTAKYLLRNIRSIFPYCNASPKQKKLKKTCFYFHLKLCPGACCGKISSKEYSSNIQSIQTLLTGDLKLIKSDLTKTIIAASQNQKYESASHFKSKLEKLTVFEKNYLPKPPTSVSPLLYDSLIRVSALEKLLKYHSLILPNQKLTRIEFYDIANLSGKFATGAMIVFHDGQSETAAYRHFHLKTINSPNDPAMLFEVITRRLKHSEWSFPDLFLIDGGKSQLSVLNSIIPPDFPLAGLAKHPDHLIIRLKNKRFQVIDLVPSAPATLLLQEMRDEAHRFARKLFHQTFLKQYQ